MLHTTLFEKYIAFGNSYASSTWFGFICIRTYYEIMFKTYCEIKVLTKINYTIIRYYLLLYCLWFIMAESRQHRSGRTLHSVPFSRDSFVLSPNKSETIGVQTVFSENMNALLFIYTFSLLFFIYFHALTSMIIFVVLIWLIYVTSDFQIWGLG